MSESMIPATAQWTVVARRQFSLLWESGRVWLLLAACVAPMAFVEVASVHARMGHAPDRPMYPAYPLKEVLPFLIAAAVVWPLLVWREESWGRREYHWSLPVQRWVHDLLRVAGGAVWLVLGVAACAAVAMLFVHLHGSAPVYLADGTHTHFHPGPLFWAGFFAGPLIAYTLASILPLSLRRPLEWGAAIIITYTLLKSVGYLLDLPRLEDGVAVLVEHRFGLRTALLGGVQNEWSQFREPLETALIPLRSRIIGTPVWLFSAALWFCVSSVGVLLATLRRR
jgi:hypothetical protein